MLKNGGYIDHSVGRRSCNGFYVATITSGIVLLREYWKPKPTLLAAEAQAALSSSYVSCFAFIVVFISDLDRLCCNLSFMGIHLVKSLKVWLVSSLAVN